MQAKPDFRWTIPARYPNEDFDEKQTRAYEITVADRAAGRLAPAHGYSADAFKQADAERRAAVALAEGGWYER